MARNLVNTYGRRLDDFRTSKTEHNPFMGGKPMILAGILGLLFRRAMPIVAITFDGNSVLWQGNVNEPPGNNLLCYIGNVSALQLGLYRLFDGRRPLALCHHSADVCAQTTARAKAKLMDLGLFDPYDLTAKLTCHLNTGKELMRCARNAALGFMGAIQRAVMGLLCACGNNVKGLAAYLTDDGNGRLLIGRGFADMGRAEFGGMFRGARFALHASKDGLGVASSAAILAAPSPCYPRLNGEILTAFEAMDEGHNEILPTQDVRHLTLGESPCRAGFSVRVANPYLSLRAIIAQSGAMRKRMAQ